MSVEQLETPDAVNEKQVGYSIRPGYKQTEIGLIPQDWYVVSIQSLLDQGTIIDHLDGNHGELYPRSHEFREYGVPYVTANDFIDGRVNISGCKCLPPDRASSFRKGIAKDGDVLFAHNATVGPTAILRTNLDYVILSTTATYFRCDLASLNNEYFHYALQSRGFVRQYQAVMSQSTRNQVPITTQRKFLISFPPNTAEQEAIAEALGDADALVESLERLLAKKRNLKQAAMQQLLTGKRRLPGFDGEWTRKQIGGEIDLLTGFPFSSNSYSDSGVRLLRGSNIKRGVTDWNDDITQFWPAITSDIKQYELRAGDIVIAMDGSLVGRSFAQLTDSDLPALLLQRVARVRSETIASNYLKAQICSPFFTDHCDSVKTVTAIPHISPKDIREYEMWIPPTMAEQTAIATVLSDMDAEIAAIEAKIDKARQIKAGMMQELLTGKTRLV